MADRTAAHIFGQIFHLLAQNPTEENKKAALILYGLIDTVDNWKISVITYPHTCEHNDVTPVMLLGESNIDKINPQYLTGGLFYV